jgi:hypothetical protein
MATSDEGRRTMPKNVDELVKSLKAGEIRRLRKKRRRQGARILRNEEYLAYAAMTNDEAQRTIRTFYEVVNDECIR